MDIQKLYWNEMVDLKYKLIYIDYYRDKSYSIDNAINIFSAISSSASIAGWVIWHDIPYVWAFIIAVSQVLSAIKIYLPYNKRVQNLNSYIEQASKIFLEYEYCWYKVATGELTNNEINEKINELKCKIDKFTNTLIAPINLPINKKFEKSSEIQTDCYFKKYNEILN